MLTSEGLLTPVGLRLSGTGNEVVGRDGTGLIGRPSEMGKRGYGISKTDQLGQMDDDTLTRTSGALLCLRNTPTDCETTILNYVVDSGSLMT